MFRIAIQEPDITIEIRDEVDNSPQDPEYDWTKVDWKNECVEKCYCCENDIRKNVDTHYSLFAFTGEGSIIYCGHYDWFLCEKCGEENKKWKLSINYPYKTRPLYSNEKIRNLARVQ